MKAMTNLKYFSCAAVIAMMLSCRAAYPNTGTATDRTGNNGATNGNGKVPEGKAHELKY